MRTIFPSALRKNIRYALYEKESDNKGYDFRIIGQVICSHVAEYDTMGDGETQHTPDFCPRNNWESLNDFTLSVMAFVPHLTHEWQAYNLQRAFTPFEKPDKDTILWLQKLVYDEDKPYRYFNFQERKISSSESKQHDKRWHRIETHHNGSWDSVRSILYESDTAYKYLTALHGICVDMIIAEANGLYSWNVTERYLKQTGSIYSGVGRDMLGNYIERVSLVQKALDAMHNASRLKEMCTKQYNWAMEHLIKKQSA